MNMSSMDASELVGLLDGESQESKNDDDESDINIDELDMDKKTLTKKKSNMLVPHKSKHEHSRSLSELLSSAEITIQTFQYNTSHDDNLPSTARESKIFDVKQFLVKDNKATKQLTEMLAPATPTINNFQSLHDDTFTDFTPPFPQSFKDESDSNKLAQLLFPVTPTIASFQSNDDNFKFDDLFIPLDNDGDDDGDDADYDYEQDIDSLLSELSLTNHENNECSSIKTCDAIKRILILLKYYQNIDQHLIQTLKNIENMQSLCILDDYHHILSHHLNHINIATVKKEFDSIYKEIDYECALSDCNKYKRHRERDRNINQQDNEQKLNEDEEMLTDSHIIYYLNLMDSIHCYLLHSYDTGMRHKMNKKGTESPSKSSKKQETKSDEINIDAKNNKYFTDMLHFDSFNKSKKKKQSTKSFDFGYKYYYWPYYKDNEYFDSGANAGYKKGDWYINKKYDNLKEEILENNIFNLSIKQFEEAKQKAIKYLNCSIAQKLQSDNVELSEFCQIKPGTAIKQENLLSLILYSDFTKLCYHFSSTFRKIDKVEQISEMKNRNSEYCNWSRLLIETVELYGTNICNSKINIFYHGVSYMTFPSFLSHFCGPTSTTPQLEVAERFCGSNGLILELVKENEFSLLKYFNMTWISGYTAEDEKLFIGGNRPLKFRSIRSMQTGENYYHYIAALTLFDYVLNGKKLSAVDKENKHYSKTQAQIIDKMMKHYDPTTKTQNKFPLFINGLFKTFVENKKHIFIHLDAINQDYPFIKPYLLSKKSGCSNLVLFDKLAKCFKNCQKITIYSGSTTDNNMTKTYLDELRESLNEINELSSHKNNHNKNSKNSKNKPVKKMKISIKKITITDVKYKHKYLDEMFRQKYRLQFPFCNLQIESETRLEKQDKNALKKGKNLLDVRRNVLHSRKNSAKVKNVGFAANEPFREFRRIVIRTDLNIHRNIRLLHQIEEASRAHTTVMAGPLALKPQFSESGVSSNPSSRRSSWLESTDSSEDSYFDHSRTLQTKDRISAAGLYRINEFVAGKDHRITEYIKDPQRLMADMVTYDEQHSQQQQRLSATTTTPINEEDEISYAYILDIDDLNLQNENVKVIQMEDFLENELTDASILGINNYSARQIWIASCLKTNKFMAKYNDLYVHLMKQFKLKLIFVADNVPTEIHLKPFFVHYFNLNEEKYDDNEDEDEELIMRSKDFDRFYVWFQSICDIISDFKHVYQDKLDNINVGIETLFYDANKTQEILVQDEYKIGTFLLRLSNKKKEIFISFKHQDNKIKHISLIRCQQHIYQISKTTKQLPISTFIKQSNLFKFLFIKNNVTRNKNQYF